MLARVPEATPAAAPLHCARRRLAARWVASFATALAGLLSLMSALTPDVPWRHALLLRVEPGSAISFEHVLAAAGGVALMLLGWGMLRGRRRAASAAIVALVALALVHTAKGLDYEEGGVAF